jgi:hypothetical protein
LSNISAKEFDVIPATLAQRIYQIGALTLHPNQFQPQPFCQPLAEAVPATRRGT